MDYKLADYCTKFDTSLRNVLEKYETILRLKLEYDTSLISYPQLATIDTVN